MCLPACSLFSAITSQELFCGSCSPCDVEALICFQCQQSEHPLGGFMQESGIRQDCYFALRGKVEFSGPPDAVGYSTEAYARENSWREHWNCRMICKASIISTDVLWSVWTPKFCL